MNNNKSNEISTIKKFDKMYNSPLHWIWSDIRIPQELKDLTAACNPRNSLELGCGLGYYSSFMAKKGVDAIGVDFSQAGIGKARQRVAYHDFRPTFKIGNVTNLDKLKEPFDVSFDVGCFHCLEQDEQQKYVSEIARLLKPGAVHLLWTMDSTPNNLKFSPEYISKVFDNEFQLANSTFSRRRIVASHWYWLLRK